MPATVTEIAPESFRLCIFVPEFNLQFSSFLVRDDESMLFHAGMRRFFPELSEAVAKLIALPSLRWVSWSHFEVDECGALNQWLDAAPKAEPLCGMVGALVNMGDYSNRAARYMAQGESVETGQHRYEYIATPHLPHGWDAGVLFDHTTKTLFCSDLFHQTSTCEPLIEGDIIGRARQVLIENESSPFAGYMPYTQRTEPMLNALADLQPQTLAIMHGSSYRGDCAQALRDLGVVFREELWTNKRESATRAA
jgi:flavorubredoxin